MTVDESHAGLAQSFLKPPAFDDILSIVVSEDMRHFRDDPEVLRAEYYNFYAAYGAQFRPREILEMGVRRGYSAFSLVRGASGSVQRYVGLDFEAEGDNFNASATALLKAQGVPEVEIRNVNTQLVFPDFGGAGFALVHVDADHSMRGALTDISSASTVLAPGGVIVVDDYSYGPVAAAAQAFAFAHGPGLRALGVSNYRGHILLWPSERLGQTRVFATLPAWAVLMIDIEDAVASVRALGSLSGPEALRPLSATAGRLLADLAAALGFPEPRSPLPSGILPALEALTGRAAEIALRVADRPDSATFRDAVDALRGHIRYVAERAPISVTERLTGPVKTPDREDPAATRALLREFSLHAANFAESVGERLLSTSPPWRDAAP